MRSAPLLIAVEIAGILGALLAIPVAGILQIIARDIWDTHRGRPKDEPTVGEDQVPVDGLPGRHPAARPSQLGSGVTP